MPFLKRRTGQQIYYECHGHSGPMVILLHGLASSSRIWLHQVRVLQKYCRVYALDFPGHGRSDWQSHYSLRDYTNAIKALMDTCQLEKASLIAISLGCSVALDFAASYPERVDKLILEGPVGGCYTAKNPLGWLDQTVFRLLPIGIELSLWMFGYHATAHWINTFGVKAKRNFRVLESVQHKTDHQAIRQLLWDSACPPYVGALEQINQETLLIRGAHDPMPKRFTDYIRRHLPKVCYLEIPETRHLVALEKPRLFNALILNFLKLTSVNQGNVDHSVNLTSIN